MLRESHLESKATVPLVAYNCVGDLLTDVSRWEQSQHIYDMGILAAKAAGLEDTKDYASLKQSLGVCYWKQGNVLKKPNTEATCASGVRLRAWSNGAKVTGTLSSRDVDVDASHARLVWHAGMQTVHYAPVG